MKNLIPLNKIEMKKVIGGMSECGANAGGATCPDGECCSQYGYCGTSVEYCNSVDGRCVMCTCHNTNVSTCWYSRRTAYDLCSAVCGSANFNALDPTTCTSNCTMN